ncbi:MAG: SPFH domain-containing protein [Bradymonadia bacterium]
MSASDNEYLQQVIVNKAEVERGLKSRRKAQSFMPEQSMASPAGGLGADFDDGPAVDVRVTGALWWKNVVVPPNAFVVHTRRGHNQPLHVGLGVSFKYNPRTDAFLVVPAAMQTIILNANCICQERQGILVQGYVQWVIDDFELAYRRLDFSDVYDPMKVVNIQLREQAEAAIKDTVATMSIDDVLADKQPIIEVLTARLRKVAEGTNNDEGLGLRIVTVQIKEAVISSSRLWTDLQRPFRAQRRKTARLAELEAEGEISAREDEAARLTAEQEIARQSAIAQSRSKAEADAFDRQIAERTRRSEQEAQLAAEQAERQRIIIEQESAVARLKAEAEQLLARLNAETEALVAERRLAVEAQQQKVRNDISPAQLRARLIEQLPELVKDMPQPEKLTEIRTGGEGLTGPVAGLVGLLKFLDG